MKSRRLEWLIIIIGILLRAGWAFGMPNKPVSDFEYYYQMAVMLSGPIEDWVLGYVGPFSSLLLALCFRLFDDTSLWIGYLLNVVLSVLSMLIFYALVRRLFRNQSDQRFALGLFAFLPTYIAYTNVIGTEIIVLVLLLALVYIQSLSRARWWHALLIGILTGLAALTKPYFMLYPVVVLWIHYRNQPTSEKRHFVKILRTGVFGLLIAATMSATISPMTIYNWNRWNMFIPISYNGGYTLYLNNNEINYIGRYIQIERIPQSPEMQAGLAKEGISYGAIDPRVEHLYQNDALKWIVSNPFHFLYLGLMREINTFLAGSIDIYLWTTDPEHPQVREWQEWMVFRMLVIVCKIIASAMVYFIVLISLFGIYVKIRDHWKRAKKRRQQLKTSSIDPTIESNKIDDNQLEDQTEEYVTADWRIQQVLLPQMQMHFDRIIYSNLLFFVGIFFVFEGQPRYSFPTLFLFMLLTVATMRRIQDRSRNR